MKRVQEPVPAFDKSKGSRNRDPGIRKQPSPLGPTGGTGISSYVGEEPQLYSSYPEKLTV